MGASGAFGHSMIHTGISELTQGRGVENTQVQRQLIILELIKLSLPHSLYSPEWKGRKTNNDTISAMKVDNYKVESQLGEKRH